MVCLSRVIGIVSGKGGVGKTTFSINLGIALGRFGKRVLVIDCNVSTPHLAYYLGADRCSITLNNIFKGEVDIRFAPLEREGVMFIPASEDINDIIGIDMMSLKNHVTTISNDGLYDFIILDSAPGLGKEALSVFQACEEIVFVTTPTIPTLTDVTRCAEVACQMGHKRFNIVLNMVRNKDYELRALDAGNLFRTPIIGTIPFDMNVMDSTSLGVPFLIYRSNSDVTDSYMKIAANLVGLRYEKPSKLRKISRKLKRLFKREKKVL